MEAITCCQPLARVSPEAVGVAQPVLVKPNSLAALDATLGVFGSNQLSRKGVRAFKDGAQSRNASREPTQPGMASADAKQTDAVTGRPPSTLSAFPSPSPIPKGRTLRFLISAGDVMGDIHAAALIKALQLAASKRGLAIEVHAVGGERVQQAGAVLLGNNSGLSSIGLVEALEFVLPYVGMKRAVEAFLKQSPPDAVVLVDLPGFNLPLAETLLKMKNDVADPPHVFYYVPPNEWLFLPRRMPLVASVCDAIFCNFPLEADFFRSIGGRVSLVGHPLVDTVKGAPTREQARAALSLSKSDVVVCLLAASRQQEVRMVWPVIAQAAALLIKDLQSKLPAGSSLRFLVPIADEALKSPILQSADQLGLTSHILPVMGDSITAMAASDLAITKSGSVNVQLALLDIPQVVVYRISSMSAWIARNILKFNPDFVSLVNIILNKKVIREFIQEQAEPISIAKSALVLLTSLRDDLMTLERQDPMDNSLQHIRFAYEELKEELGTHGAANRASEQMLDKVAMQQNTL